MAPMPMALMSTPAVAPGWFVESVVGDDARVLNPDGI